VIAVFDENLAISIARALEILGKPAKHVTDLAPRGTPDHQLVPKVAEINGFLVSHDGQMLHNVATVAAFRKYEVKLVVFHNAQVSTFELARLLLWAWPEVHHHIGLGHQFLEIGARGKVSEKRLRR
jgi:predicted nuclease of predicted toxin-antitoxin system